MIAPMHLNVTFHICGLSCLL